MEVTMVQDAMGTHLDWRHEDLTAHMIDWFWSNMEKGFLLWHPAQHEPPADPDFPKVSARIRQA